MNINFKKTSGQLIKEIRTELKLSQTEFGKLANGVSKAAVSGWERDISTPERDSLMGLQKNLKLNPAYLLGQSDVKYVHEVKEPDQNYNKNSKEPSFDITEDERKTIEMMRNMIPDDVARVREVMRAFAKPKSKTDNGK